MFAPSVAIYYTYALLSLAIPTCTQAIYIYSQYTTHIPLIHYLHAYITYSSGEVNYQNHTLTGRGERWSIDSAR